MIIDAALLTQAHIDEAKEGFAHVLVAIGHLGDQLVYMDVDLETIRTRFATERYGNGEVADMNDESATVLGFDDSFETYELKF